MLESFLFYNFGILAVGGAIGLISFRVPLYAALSLVLSLVSVAGLYLLLHAKTLFLIQIVVYAGAIMVLSLFVLMYFNIKGGSLFIRFNLKSFIVVLPVLAIFVSAITFLGEFGGKFSEVATEFGDIKPLGFELFLKWTLSFEAVSLLLTAALIGIVALLRSGDDK